jgi:DNA-cytosine methyltransferase
MKKLRVGSLFSGIGSPEIAFKEEEVEIDLKFYSEFDPECNIQYASKAYSLIHNIPESLNLGDINKIDEKLLPDLDLITFGFPCQSFSIQGKRLGFEDEVKGNLFFETMRLVKEKKPKILIAENVKGLVNHDKGETFKTILKTLNDLGYNNYYKILNSVNFNLPQSRERIFIVSIRKDIDNNLFTFNEGEMTKLTVYDILDLTSNRKQMKENLKPYNNTEYFKVKYSSNTNIIKLFDGVAENYFKSSFSLNRIYSVNGVSPTLTTSNDAVYSEIGGHLTSKERFALQGIPIEYVDILMNNGFPKSKIDKISGNTLSVNVFRSIIKDLKKAELI